ncbi:uncharacterized protein M6D78_017318 [Vipera latastei]
MDLGLHEVLGANQGSQVTECQLDMELASEVLVTPILVSPWEVLEQEASLPKQDIWVVLELDVSQAMGCRMDMAMAMELEPMDFLLLELSQVVQLLLLLLLLLLPPPPSMEGLDNFHTEDNHSKQKLPAWEIMVLADMETPASCHMVLNLLVLELRVKQDHLDRGGPQVGYEPQPAQAIGLDGNGNGLGYLNSRDLQANGLGAGGYAPIAAGQAPGGFGSLLGPGQPLGGYRGKESKYGMNGYLGNGYRGRCSSGKC